MRLRVQSTAITYRGRLSEGGEKKKEAPRAAQSGVNTLSPLVGSGQLSADVSRPVPNDQLILVAAASLLLLRCKMRWGPRRGVMGARRFDRKRGKRVDACSRTRLTPVLTLGWVRQNK